MNTTVLLRAFRLIARLQRRTKTRGLAAQIQPQTITRESTTNHQRNNASPVYVTAGIFWKLHACTDLERATDG